MIIEIDTRQFGAALLVILAHVLWHTVMCRQLEARARIDNFYPHMTKVNQEDVDQ